MVWTKDNVEILTNIYIPWQNYVGINRAEGYLGKVSKLWPGSYSFIFVEHNFVARQK